MKTDTIYIDKPSIGKLLSLKLKDIMELTKFRLSFLVVFSAVMAYLLANPFAADWLKITLLSLGGFLVTASSNTINQLIEKDTDKLMDRTKNRPLPVKLC